MRADRMSYDDLLERVAALLEEWGECQRAEPGIGGIGWPGETVESRMMRERARPKKGKKRQAAFISKRRVVDMGVDENGKHRYEAVLDMIPAQTQRQTASRKLPITGPWPEHIQEVEAILATMPKDLLRAVKSCYIRHDTVRVGAEMLGVKVHEYRQRLERAQWFVAGQLAARAA